jgi:DNA-binding transcriptional regulator LsrR (DeoR family)
MRRKAGDLEVLAAAYLYGQGQTQDMVGRTLEVSQSVVSRLISEAVRKGYLETKTRFVRERVSAEEFARIEARVRPARLQKVLSALGGPGTTVHVYPSHSRNTSAAAWRHRLDEFAGASAKDVQEALGPAALMGVSWGDTVASLIGAMERLPAAGRPSRARAAGVVPLLGEPLGLNITQHSSSVLAARLEAVLNGPAESHALSLAPVPALIPADMTEAETAAIRRLIGRITAYREIFGAGNGADDGRTPLVGRLEAILTSTSTQERPLSFGEDDSLIRAAGMPRSKLNELVAGDICGALIARSNLAAGAQEEVESIRRRWTGITISQLRDCAVRARDSGAPGIVVTAIGSNKATVIHAAAKMGLIQHLFIDQDLADRLEQLAAA